MTKSLTLLFTMHFFICSDLSLTALCPISFGNSCFVSCLKCTFYLVICLFSFYITQIEIIESNISSMLSSFCSLTCLLLYSCYNILFKIKVSISYIYIGDQFIPYREFHTLKYTWQIGLNLELAFTESCLTLSCLLPGSSDLYSPHLRLWKLHLESSAVCIGWHDLYSACPLENPNASDQKVNVNFSFLSLSSLYSNINFLFTEYKSNGH